MEAAFEKAWNTYGRLDVVVANAGIINFNYTWDLTDSEVEKALAVNLEGTWRTDKYAVLYMRNRDMDALLIFLLFLDSKEPRSLQRTA